MKAVFRYAGSKWRIADWIVSFFPAGYENMVYVEPFAGSAAVFFRKKPGVMDTVNDLNGDIVNLYRVMRDHPEELKRVLELTPYSREEYDRSFETCEDPVERARRYMVRTTQSIGARLNQKCGWQRRSVSQVGGGICAWANIQDRIAPVAGRLRGTTTHLVQIEHMDAIKLIEQFDRPGVLLYLDPPYVLSSRAHGKMYTHEMDDAQQTRLLELVVRSSAKIVLSGYRSALYDEALMGWHRFSTTSRTTSGEEAEECVWINYEPPYRQMTMEGVTRNA